VFLDYDGTLTPIVDSPADATLPSAVREILGSLAQRLPVAVVTGRDTDDVVAMVDVPGLWFAGSHGFDVRTPAGDRIRVGAGEAALPALEAAATELAPAIESTPGAWAEPKAFALTIHHRSSPRDALPALVDAVREVAARHDELRVSDGKEILELRPAVDWHKGAAIEWLLDAMGFGDGALPVFIGDDVTDEDGFTAVRRSGIGVVVGASGDRRSTAAHYRLSGPEDVEAFLREVLELLD